MNLPYATTVPAAKTGQPTFPGIVRGEFYKALRLRVTLVGAILAFIPPLIMMGYLFTSDFIPTTLAAVPAAQRASEGYFIEQLFERALSLTRDFSGMALLVLTVLVVGQEFQQGTLRIILARGVDRVQLLLGKLLAVFGIGLGALAIYVSLVFGLMALAVAHSGWGMHSFQQLPSTFGGDMLVYVGSMILNAAATIMLGMVVTIIGRSVLFGMGVALLFFPADSILVNVLGVIGNVTHSDVWSNATAYLFGPTLNALPIALLLGQRAGVRGVPPVISDGTHPLVFYDGTHAVVVVCIYMLAFAAIGVILMRQRDVQE